MSQVEVDKVIPQSGTTLTIGDSGDTIAIASGATLTSFTSTGIDDNATSTAITITSGNDVCIGSTNSGVGGLIDLSIGNTSSAGGITLWSTTSASHSIGFGDGYTGTDRYRGYLEYDHAGDSMRFATSATERMRIDSSGHVLVGTTDPLAGVSSSSGKGIALRSEGYIFASIPNDAPLTINRQTSDGNIAQFRKDGVTVGSIGAHNTRITIGNEDTGLKFNSGIDSIFPFDLSIEANRDNAVDLGFSTARFRDLYLGGGLYVGGTGTANKLDDYEEGTFTPTLVDASLNAATGSFKGRYTKVGNRVTIDLRLVDINTTGLTAGSAIYIGNFPFAAQTSDTQIYSIGAVMSDSISFGGYIVSELQGGSGYMNLKDCSSGSNDTAITVSDITSGSADLLITHTYETV